eukprot:gb/GECH01006342.1/.p1 GENE.gb/GECH01006342.1/~~gb/GECH01006342.1/.p1  ORF type:complete len:332 (+),score=76.29 gb/GECH01006342.1/:1-996(+)
MDDVDSLLDELEGIVSSQDEDTEYSLNSPQQESTENHKYDGQKNTTHTNYVNNSQRERIEAMNESPGKKRRDLSSSPTTRSRSNSLYETAARNSIPTANRSKRLEKLKLKKLDLSKSIPDDVDKEIPSPRELKPRGLGGEVDLLLNELEDEVGSNTLNSPRCDSPTTTVFHHYSSINSPSAQDNYGSPRSRKRKDSCPKKKCFSPLIGGTQYSTGFSTATKQQFRKFQSMDEIFEFNNQSPKVCDRLRCTRCDFQVSRFVDYVWSSDVDYLFFRNNSPYFYQLKTKLYTQEGWAAYACQCSWASVKTLTQISEKFGLHWICVGHNNTEMFT